MKLKIVFCLCIFLKLLDVLTTYFLVYKFGPEGEMNPVVKYTIEQLGLTAAMIFNYFASIALCYWVFKRKIFYALFIIFVGFLAVVINNFYAIAQMMI